jgi:hypothetical protein
VTRAWTWLLVPNTKVNNEWKYTFAYAVMTGTTVLYFLYLNGCGRLKMDASPQSKSMCGLCERSCRVFLKVDMTTNCSVRQGILHFVWILRNGYRLLKSPPLVSVSRHTKVYALPSWF